MLDVGISEIHGYPLRSKGFEEPLFATTASKREIMEHLLEAPWLCRASELEGRTGEAAHALEEPVRLRNWRGRIDLVRPWDSRRCSWRRRSVVKVLHRWREVRGWWDQDHYMDRTVFRVLLSGGEVIDLSRKRAGGWFLVGVVD